MGEGGGVVVAGEVEVHADAGGDEELVCDGVFVGGEVGGPDHAAGAEGGVPAAGGEVVEEAGAVRVLGDELAGVPGVVGFVVGVCGGRGGGVVEGGVEVDEFYCF